MGKILYDFACQSTRDGTSHRSAIRKVLAVVNGKVASVYAFRGEKKRECDTHAVYFKPSLFSARSAANVVNAHRSFRCVFPNSCNMRKETSLLPSANDIRVVRKVLLFPFSCGFLFFQGATLSFLLTTFVLNVNVFPLIVSLSFPFRSEALFLAHACSGVCLRFLRGQHVVTLDWPHGSYDPSAFRHGA